MELIQNKINNNLNIMWSKLPHTIYRDGDKFRDIVYLKLWSGVGKLVTLIKPRMETKHFNPAVKSLRDSNYRIEMEVNEIIRRQNETNTN